MKSRNTFSHDYKDRSDAAKAADKLEKKAFDLAYSAHAGQKYGEHPYIYHLEMVASAIPWLDTADVTQFSIMKAAALLHDVIEDTPITREQVAEECGKEVADIVWELTNRPEEVNDKSRDLEFARLSGISLSAKIIKATDLACNMACCVADNSPYLSGYVAAWPRYNAALAEAWTHHKHALESIQWCLRIASEPGKWRPQIQSGLVTNIWSN